MPLIKRPRKAETVKVATRAGKKSAHVKTTQDKTAFSKSAAEMLTKSTQLKKDLFDSSISARDLWLATLTFQRECDAFSKKMSKVTGSKNQQLIGALAIDGLSTTLFLAMMKQNSIMGNIKYALSVANYGLKIAAAQAARGLHFAAQKTLAGVVALLKNIENASKFVYRQIKRALTAVKNAIVFAAQQTAHGLHFAAQKTLAGAMALLNGVVNVVKAVVEAVKDVAANITFMAKTLIQAAGHKTLEGLKAVLNGFVSLVKATVEIVKDIAWIVKALVTFVVAPALASAATAVKDAVTTAAVAVKDTVTDAAAAVKDKATETVDALNEIVEQLPAETRNEWHKVMRDVLGALGSAFGAVSRAMAAAETNLTTSSDAHGSAVRRPVRTTAPAAAPEDRAVVHDHDSMEHCTGCQAKPAARAEL